MASTKVSPPRITFPLSQHHRTTPKNALPRGKPVRPSRCHPSKLKIAERTPTRPSRIFRPRLLAATGKSGPIARSQAILAPKALCRCGEPDDLAGASLFLTSPLAN